jgi:hypothetical protein
MRDWMAPLRKPDRFAAHVGAGMTSSGWNRPQAVLSRPYDLVMVGFTRSYVGQTVWRLQVAPTSVF